MRGRAAGGSVSGPGVGPGASLGLGFAAWACGALAAWALEGRADLGSQAMPLVLAAALAGLWWPVWAGVAACVVATLGFNYAFVPPRGTFEVRFERDGLLLMVLLVVGLAVTLLVDRQRRLAARERQQADRLRRLQALSDGLRLADDAEGLLAALSPALAPTLGDRAAGPRPADRDPDPDADADADADAVPPAGFIAYLVAGGESGPRLIGRATAEEAEGLRQCASQGLAMGPGTGRYEQLPAWYLPLRGGAAPAPGSPPAGGGWTAADPALGHEPQALGAVRLLLPGGAQDGRGPAPSAAELTHAQAMCDLTGQALRRLRSGQAAASARQQAEAHALRSTLLAAVAHDVRTPLAAILGAGSSLATQGERLAPAQRHRLAETIVDEATQLARLTDNALQLARLDAAPQAIERDWASIEELVGAVLRRVRARDPARRVRSRLVGELPLIRCDGVLMVQLLENLIDNALKYSPLQAPVEVLGRRQGEALLLAVRDRGPGLPPAQRARLFEAFERGDAARAAGVRGAGLGLALCQAVAQAHGSRLKARARGHGGTSFELLLPVEPMPAAEAPGASVAVAGPVAGPRREPGSERGGEPGSEPGGQPIVQPTLQPIGDPRDAPSPAPPARRPPPQDPPG